MRGLPILSVLVAMLCVAPVRPDDGTIGLPPIEAAAGLPSHKIAREVSEAAESNRCQTQSDRARDASWVWWCVSESTNPHRPILARRLALKRLIDMVGWSAVLTGELPPIPWGE